MGASGSAAVVSLSGEKKCACVEELLYLGHAANVLCTASSASDSRGKMMLWHIVFVKVEGKCWMWVPARSALGRKASYSLY